MGENKTEIDNVYDRVVTCAHFGVSLMGTMAYGIAKVKRYAEANTGNVSDLAPVEKVKQPVDTVLDILGYVSYACHFVKFMTPVYAFLEEGEIPIVGIRLKNVPGWAKTILQTLIILMLIRIAIRVWGKHQDKIAFLKKKNKDWEKPISLLSKGGGFAFGIFQLVMVLKEGDLFEGQKLFAWVSVVDSLTAPLDMIGIDNLIMKNPKAFVAVYGVKTLIKSVQTAGVLR